jgi:short-subunit dehydrogenase
MMDFKSKYGLWALIVGASEGLGAAFANNAAQRGLNVALVARRAPALAQVAADLRAKHGVDTREISADAGAPDFLETVQAGTQGLEIGLMIFNAGIQPGGPFLRIKMEDHLACIQIQCVAPTRLCHWLGREMVARGRGGLVLISSGAAQQGLAHWASYSGAKAYELILAEALWDELRDQGVNVVGYVVGMTATPNFIRSQAKFDLPFAKSVDPNDYPPGTPLPRPPQEVADALFDQLEDGPRIYPNPEDRAAAEAAAKMPRAELVAAAGAGSKATFPSGLNELMP